MLRQMERSAMQLLAKRGRSQRQIAAEFGRNRRTVARGRREPVDRVPTSRQRSSTVDPYRPQIEAGIQAGLSTDRILEIARSDPEQPYTGSRSHFGEIVRRIRRELAHEQAV